VTPAFARAALRRGAVIREQVEVVAAEHGNGRFSLRGRSPDGEEVVVVSEVLVNATGAWCGEFAARFGEPIPVFAAGPAEIVTEPVPRFVEPVMHVVDGSVLFRQTRRGNVIIGGHPRMSVDAETRRTRVPPEKIATNLGRLVGVAPFMRAHHVIRTWTGIEGYLADMRPVLGPSSTTPGLFHACAFSGHGLQVGPAVAQVLTELIVDGATDTPIEAFDIRRFASAAETVGTLAEEFQADVPVGESLRTAPPATGRGLVETPPED
jgi:sarcosine oxidase subunit beta